MYFAAAIAIHHSEGGGTFHGGGVVLSMGVAYPCPGGFDFGPYMVNGRQGGGIHGGSAKPKVLLLTKLLELQYYFAPFSKAAK